MKSAWHWTLRWRSLLPLSKVSNAKLQLRFDGPALKSHAIDVTLLGPSLLAFGELCNEANRVLNGGETKIKVLLHADVKANCVTIDLEVIQSLWQAATHLIQSQNVHDAKEILEWIGILKEVGEYVVGGTVIGGGLIGFLRWKKDRKIIGTEIKQTDRGSIVVLKIEGDNNNVTFSNAVSESVFNLSKSVKVVEAVKTLVNPVSETNGIEEATFIHKGKDELKIDQDCAAELQKAYADSEESEPQPFSAHIVIYAPVLDKDSKKWRFKFNNRVETIDISETKIAEDARKRGKVVWGDTYHVKMEMREHKTRTGDFKIDYKVKEVIAFRPGDELTQTSFPLTA
jgi:hypothetical protein